MHPVGLVSSFEKGKKKKGESVICTTTCQRGGVRTTVLYYCTVLYCTVLTHYYYYYYCRLPGDFILKKKTSILQTTNYKLLVTRKYDPRNV